MHLGGQSGAGEGGTTDQDRQHRVLLVRHRRGPAAALRVGLGHLADLGPGEHQHVVGDVPHRIGGSDQRIGVPGEHRAVRVPRDAVVEAEPARRVGDQELCRVGITRDLHDGGQGAGRAAELHGEAQGLQVLAGVEDALQPPGGLEPEGDRHGVLGQRATGHDVVAVASDQPGQCRHLAIELVEHTVGRRARQPDQRGVDDVLAGEPAVEPPDGRVVRQLLADEGQHRDDGVAAVLRPEVADRWREVGEPGPLTWRGRDPCRHERVEPRLLHLEHRAQHRVVGEDVAGPFVAGPQQIGHQAPKSRKTVSLSPCRWMSNTRPSSPPCATSVERRSAGSDSRKAASACSGR